MKFKIINIINLNNKLCVIQIINKRNNQKNKHINKKQVQDIIKICIIKN